MDHIHFSCITNLREKKNQWSTPIQCSPKKSFCLIKHLLIRIFFQFFDLEKLAKFTFKLAKLVKFTLGKKNSLKNLIQKNATFFWQFNLPIGIKLWPFPRPNGQRWGASLTSEVYYLWRMQHKMEDWLAVWDSKPQVQVTTGVWNWTEPDGNVQFERGQVSGFRDELVPGTTRLWNIKRAILLQYF